jgi:hypothetical protein
MIQFWSQQSGTAAGDETGCEVIVARKRNLVDVLTK